MLLVALISNERRKGGLTIPLCTKHTEQTAPCLVIVVVVVDTHHTHTIHTRTRHIMFPFFGTQEEDGDSQSLAALRQLQADRKSFFFFSHSLSLLCVVSRMVLWDGPRSNGRLGTIVGSE